MKLERLEIAGFMHFDAPAVLDLRDVPRGLVSITGENGEGKTRLLDAGLAAVYGGFPSREGVLADYATSRSAYIEATFSVETRGTYRSRYNVDGEKRTSDAVLELLQPDGSRTVLNDGKVSTHRDAVAHVFPPKDLVLASAFAAQNRAGSFASLGKKDRKDLFGILLGLGQYERMATVAKAAADLVEATRARLQERCTGLAARASQAVADDLERRADTLQAEGGEAEARREELRITLDNLDADRPMLIAQAQAHRDTAAQLQALDEAHGARKAELGQLEADQDRAHADYATELTALEQRATVRRVELDTDERTSRETYGATVTDLDARIAGNRTLIAKAADIRIAAATKRDAEQQIEQLRTEYNETSGQWEEATRQVQFRRKAIDGEGLATAQARLDTRREQAAMLTTVPCGGEGQFAGCQFLTHAKAAEDAIPELEGAVVRAAHIRDGITLWQERADAYAETMKAKRIAIAQVQERVKKSADLAKYEPELAATEARIEGYAREKGMALDALTMRLAELDLQRTRVEEARHLGIEDARVRRDAWLAELEARHTTLMAECMASDRQRLDLQAALAETAAAAEHLAELETALAAARAVWTSVEAAIAVYTAQRAQLQRDRDAFLATVHELSAAQDRLHVAEDRLLVWQCLGKALGRDGLPTLEIAAAGPTVSSLTNDLLSACFGTRFSVELVTQEPKADGKGLKETFDLHVFDNEHGGDARDLADLSGGERVVVDEALRAAIGLFKNLRNVAPVRTFWRDETTGALDPENAVRYVAMLRRLMDLAGLQHLLFITHNPDAAALADTRIVVTKGQPELVRKAA